MKLWHDDIRKPTEGWTWARTNAEAQRLLLAHEFEECSLDHDLGAHNVDPNDAEACFIAGTSPDGSGYDLVRWMIANDRIPAKVTIHSWNQAGARRMAYALADSGHKDITVQPYEIGALRMRSAIIR